MFTHKVILNFRFWEEYLVEQPILEPDICVTCPLIALKILRNFGHLITNLHLDYNLFFFPDAQRNPKFFKFIECYLAEYCSESLQQISLQGGLLTYHRKIFEHIQKPFINVNMVQTEQCSFGEELPYQKVFPNLKTLKHERNNVENVSVIPFKLTSLENL